MWLGEGYAEKGPCGPKCKIIPGVLDSSINGKALGSIKFIVSHFVGVGSHPGITGS